MFGRTEIKNALGIDTAVSSQMTNAIDLWGSIYANRAPWVGKKCKSMNLGKAIASSFAMMATIEMESVVDDEVINMEYQKLVDKLREYTEYGCGKGGFAAKPYLSNGEIAFDITQAEYFFPTAFDSKKRITGAIFIDRKIEGKNVYTRAEHHVFEQGNYVITNRAFLKTNVIDYTVQNDFGKEISLSEVEEWADIQPKTIITDIEQPLFAYFRMPGANPIDDKTPLGMSVYGNAVDQIKEADRQWTRTMWEYEATEAAIFADQTLFRPKYSGGYGKPGGFASMEKEIPEGKERLFHLMQFKGDEKDMLIPYGPEIRDSALFHGLDQILKRIEYNVGLSFGILSDPANVDKTATEVIASKQRMYSTVKDIQKALQQFLEDAAYAIAGMMAVSGLYENMDYSISFNWDDSILVDKNTELLMMQQDANSRLIRPEYYIAKKYGLDLEQAKEMMPEQHESEYDPFNNLI